MDYDVITSKNQPIQQAIQNNIRELLDSSLPLQIGQLEESTISLERVAAFCEANYIQSADKAAALSETKNYTLQSLASVAYMINELARSLIHAMELETVNLAQKSNEVKNMHQLITIQKEKSARREIGKLTTPKNVLRQNKIIYPANEPGVSRYQRTTIDFSLLDGIGHGHRLVASEYGNVGQYYSGTYSVRSGNTTNTMIERTASTLSGNSGGEAINYSGIGNHNQQHEHGNLAGNYGTLVRGSLRLGPSVNSSVYDQYRVPQTIPSALQRDVHTRSHYLAQQPSIRHSNDQHQQQITNGGGQSNANNNNVDNNGMPLQQQQQQDNDNGQHNYEQYISTGTMMRPQMHGHGHQQQFYHMLEQENGTGELRVPPAAGVGQMYTSADYSDDGLPLPPPLLAMSGGPPAHQHQQQFVAAQSADELLPVPPAFTNQHMLSEYDQQQPQEPSWIPQEYIEKASVLYDYDSRNADELHLYRGGIVYVLRKNEDGWYEGVLDGITGLFPGNYVQPLQ